MPPAFCAITRARSYLHARTLLRCRRAVRTTSSSCTDWLLRCAAVINTSRPAKQAVSTLHVARCVAGEASALWVMMGDSALAVRPSWQPRGKRQQVCPAIHTAVY